MIRQGIRQGEGKISCYPFSAIHQDSVIREILKDTLDAYKLAQELAMSPDLINRQSICDIHALLMRTAAFWGEGYSNPGLTRTQTKKTVTILPVSGSGGSAMPGQPRSKAGFSGSGLVINGYSGGAGSRSYIIEYCPYDEVDGQLDAFCDISKRWLQNEDWDNPFALASWMHMSLAACHPFDDGNGRLARIVASIPLFAAGYPPFSLTLARRKDYYGAIHQAHLQQNHTPTVHCILDSMKETMRDIEWIFGTPGR